MFNRIFVVLLNLSFLFVNINGFCSTYEWNQSSSVLSPPSVFGASMVYDPHTQQTILFGGMNNESGCLNETWAFDGENWTQLHPNVSPPARADASMVYDETMDKIVLFGGYEISGRGNGVFNDTWTFDVSTLTWKQLDSSFSPSSRFEASAVYDSTQGKMILFGGIGEIAGLSGLHDLRDTWSFDLSTETWTQLNPECSPTARHGASIAYDSDNDKIFLFGGGDKICLKDLWCFDGSEWKQVDISNTPGARTFASMVYNKISKRIILFGGLDIDCDHMPRSLFDTWSFDGSQWVNCTDPLVTERYGAAICYDSTRNTIVLYGGMFCSPVFGIYHTLNDTWLLTSIH